MEGVKYRYVLFEILVRNIGLLLYIGLKVMEIVLLFKHFIRFYQRICVSQYYKTFVYTSLIYLKTQSEVI